MRPSRHAILLLVHKNPEQVKRLVDRLRHPRVDLFVHVDAKFPCQPFAFPKVELVARRKKVDWAGFGGIEATLEWMAHCLAKGGYSKYTLLTGQDYPLRSIDEIVEILDAQVGERIDTSWSDEDRRYRYEVFWGHPGEQPGLRAFWTRLVRRLWYRTRPLRRMPKGLPLAAGSAYWTLTESGVAWILEFLASRPDITAFFRNTFAPDEMFFQMILRADPRGRDLQPDNHFIDWSLRLEHPKLLDSSDFDRIVSSGSLFARKFDAAQDAAVLDRLDELALRRSL